MKLRHPGLTFALRKLQQGKSLTEEELQRLTRQLSDLETQTGQIPVTVEASEQEVTPQRCPLTPCYATREGTHRLATRSGLEVNFYREAQDLLVSTIGLGTYLGSIDRDTDAGYSEAVYTALQGGVNLIDTSLNYRAQRSELSVAAGLQRFCKGGGSRDEVILCSKGGFLVPGAVTETSISAEEIAGGIHCIAPAFLLDQIKRSRKNLGVQTIDIYYLHNPETQLNSVDAEVFADRIRAAFTLLESAVADGLIRYYGVTTWDGYLLGKLPLATLIAIAREIGGEQHRCRFIQLPLNLAVQDDSALPTQGLGDVLDLAKKGRITVVASASLLQGRLARDLPQEIADIIVGLQTDAQRAIQFTRSTPGVTAALVGTSKAEHVSENLALGQVAPLTADAYEHLRNILRH
jgi:aryl-alcohol dehydrogenase-like predicted oxidoreductase